MSIFSKALIFAVFFLLFGCTPTSDLGGGFFFYEDSILSKSIHFGKKGSRFYGKLIEDTVLDYAYNDDYVYGVRVFSERYSCLYKGQPTSHIRYYEHIEYFLIDKNRFNVTYYLDKDAFYKILSSSIGQKAKLLSYEKTYSEVRQYLNSNTPYMQASRVANCEMYKGSARDNYPFVYKFN